MVQMKVLTEEGLNYLVQKIDGQLETKVNVETGKGLSTNDYTTAEKEALAQVVQDVAGLTATGGQANVIETVKVDGVALVPDEKKAVNIDLSKFALKSEIVNAMYWRGTVADVASLPTDAAVGDIYHVTATGGEHAWDGSAWQELGSILDLSDYSTTEEVNGLISAAVAGKANSADVYTKGEADTAISGAVADKATKTYVDEQLALKAVAADVYTKTETYTKTEVNNLLAGKADNGHKHELADVNGLESALGGKADASAVYTKTEADNLLAAKANAADFSAISNSEIDALFA